MAETRDDNNLSRRGFLDSLLDVMAVLTAGAAVFTVAKYVLPPHEAKGASDEVEVPKGKELPVGEAVKFAFHGKPALLIHSKTGFISLSAVCTHLGCIVDWNKEKQLVTCPCHNAVFDFNGNIVSGPPPLPLQQYEVDERDTKIMVREKG